MKRYLDSIIARTHNPQDVIQPRTFSIFEPPGAKGPNEDWLNPESPADTSASIIPREEGSTSPKAAFNVNVEDDRVPSAVGQIGKSKPNVKNLESGDDQNGTTHFIRRSASATRVLNQKPLAASALDISASESVEVGGAPPGKPLRMSADPVISSVRHPPELPPAQTSGQEITDDTPSIDLRDERGAGMVPEVDRRESENVAHVRAATDSNRADGTRLVPHVASVQPVMRVEKEEGELSRLIRVTIGRVDVRAVFPTRPESRQRTKKQSPPRMTLDDYLSRRTKKES